MKQYLKAEIIVISMNGNDILTNSPITPGGGNNELPMISGDDIFGSNG